jgi:hypothetical protein
VHAVDAQKHPLGGRSLCVDMRQHLGDRLDRQLHTGTGVHPGDREHPGAGSNGGRQPSDDLVGGGGGGLVVDGDAADDHPVADRA